MDFGKLDRMITHYNKLSSTLSRGRSSGRRRTRPRRRQTRSHPSIAHRYQRKGKKRSSRRTAATYHGSLPLKYNHDHLKYGVVQENKMVNVNFTLAYDDDPIKDLLNPEATSTDTFLLSNGMASNNFTAYWRLKLINNLGLFEEDDPNVDEQSKITNQIVQLRQNFREWKMDNIQVIIRFKKNTLNKLIKGSHPRIYYRVFNERNVTKCYTDAGVLVPNSGTGSERTNVAYSETVKLSPEENLTSIYGVPTGTPPANFPTTGVEQLFAWNTMKDNPYSWKVCEANQQTLKITIPFKANFIRTHDNNINLCPVIMLALQDLQAWKPHTQKIEDNDTDLARIITEAGTDVLPAIVADYTVSYNFSFRKRFQHCVGLDLPTE